MDTAIIKVVIDMLCALDHSQCTSLVPLDLGAAFDTIDPQLSDHVAALGGLFRHIWCS